MSNTQQSDPTRPTIGLPIHGIAATGQKILLGIVDAAQELDVNVVCFDGGVLCGQELDGQSNMLYEVVPEFIDGLIFWGDGSFFFFKKSEYKRFLQRYRPRPMVAIGGTVVKDVPNVVASIRQGIVDVVTHLIQSHGCHRIAYIHGNHVEAPLRYQGYVDALEENGIPLDPSLIIGDQARLGNAEDGFAAITKLLDKQGLSPPDDFEAVMASSDMLAIGANSALQQRGFRVPDDVAVGGFDNHDRAAIVTPTLTTAHKAFYNMGRQAVNFILRMLRGEEVPAVVEVPVPLIIRESCGCYSSSVSLTAAPGRPAPAVPQENSLQDIRTGEILTELERFPVSSEQTLFPGCMRQLVEGFLVELRDNSPGIFLITLRQIITTLIMPAVGTGAGHEVNILNNVVTSLRQTLLPYYAGDLKVREQAEHLWQQARILIGEAQGRLQSQMAFEVEQYSNLAQQFGKSLITTFDIQELMKLLLKGLPVLGIKSCVLAFYEDPQPYAYPSQPRSGRGSCWHLMNRVNMMSLPQNTGF